VPKFASSPWAGRYSPRPKFTPDKALLDLSLAMGVVGNTQPWAGRSQKPTWLSGLNQDGAFYAPRLDRLQLPDYSRFTSKGQYTRIVLHELAHATAHNKRLDRQSDEGGFYEQYAHEELVADLTSHLVSYRLGWPGVSAGEAARYIQMYLADCQDRVSARAYAEREARRAADYLVALVKRQPNG
jgi:antirestriction protein ArdC